MISFFCFLVNPKAFLGSSEYKPPVCNAARGKHYRRQGCAIVPYLKRENRAPTASVRDRE
jgi:hypothetical protein